MNTENQIETKDKRTLYKTARALIGCAYFKKGDFVSVKYDCQNYTGVHYFTCKAANDEREVEYPEHHLSEFCL